jgi:hypothetical protein
VQKIASSISLIQGRFAASLPKLTDGDVLLIYTFALLAGGVIRRVQNTYLHAEETTTFFSAATQINAGELLAFFAIATVLRSKIDPVRLSKFDYVVTSVCALFFLLPKQGLPFVGATIAGLYFWRWRPPNAQLASAGQLWLAISAYRFWGILFFQIVAVPIVQVEAFVIGKIGQLLGFGLTVEGVRLYGPNGWFVYVMEGCSSFHNSSLAVLVWLSLIKLAGSKVSGSNLMALGIGILAIFCLNVLRILLMTPSEEAYHFWHEGGGATLFSCLTFGAIAGPTFLSLREQR